MSSHNIPELDAIGLRKFAYTTAAAIIVLFAIVIPRIFNLSFPVWPCIGAGVLALWGAIKPATLNPVYKLWMRFGLLMSRITTPLILGLVYFLLFTPIAFVMRRFGRDTLKKNLDHNTESYRIESTVPDYTKTMERPY